MNQKGFINVILIGVVLIIALGAGYFALVKKPTKFVKKLEGPNTPTLIGSDNDIDAFTKKANLPISGIGEIFIDEPTQNLKVFKINYGTPRDCLAGCITSDATGIEYGSKIGWISVNDFGDSNISKFVMYNFDASDTHLFTDDFFQLLKARDVWVYQNAFLPKLIADKDVPEQVKAKARSLLGGSSN